MRLFTAIELPEETRDSLVEAQAELKRRIEGKVSWVAGKNLHVTLKFLGEVADAEVVRVCDALKAVSVPRLTISVAKLGALPPHGRAKVLMADLAGQADELAKLFDSIEGACEPLGFAREQRRFHPHITLGRLRMPRRVSHEIEAVKLKPSEPFEVREFLLMQSHLTSKGSEYQRVTSVGLL